MNWLLLGWCGVAILVAMSIGRAVSRRERSSGDADGRRPQPVPALAATAPAAARLAGATATTNGYVDEMPVVHDILVLLERREPRIAKIALLKWIGGLSTRAVAEAMRLQVPIVERDLQFAQTFLRHGTFVRDAGRVE